jgi:hypothetical protein
MEPPIGEHIVRIFVSSPSLNTQAETDIEHADLDKLLDQIKGKETFRWSLTLFLLSFFLEILFLIPKISKGKKATKENDDSAPSTD